MPIQGIHSANISVHQSIQDNNSQNQTSDPKAEKAAQTTFQHAKQSLKSLFLGGRDSKSTTPTSSPADDYKCNLT